MIAFNLMFSFLQPALGYGAFDSAQQFLLGELQHKALHAAHERLNGGIGVP
jgi:hypothetical protein